MGIRVIVCCDLIETKWQNNGEKFNKQSLWQEYSIGLISSHLYCYHVTVWQVTVNGWYLQKEDGRAEQSREWQAPVIRLGDLGGWISYMLCLGIPGIRPSLVWKMQKGITWCHEAFRKWCWSHFCVPCPQQLTFCVSEKWHTCVWL